MFTKRCTFLCLVTILNINSKNKMLLQRIRWPFTQIKILCIGSHDDRRVCQTLVKGQRRDFVKLGWMCLGHVNVLDIRKGIVILVPKTFYPLI